MLGSKTITFEPKAGADVDAFAAAGPAETSDPTTSSKPAAAGAHPRARRTRRPVNGTFIPLAPPLSIAPAATNRAVRNSTKSPRGGSPKTRARTPPDTQGTYDEGWSQVEPSLSPGRLVRTWGFAAALCAYLAPFTWMPAGAETCEALPTRHNRRR